VLTTFRAYIADYVAPWVDKANDLIRAKIKPEDVGIFFCIPVLMGVCLKADELPPQIALRSILGGVA
jgi:hypothetical protein